MDLTLIQEYIFDIDNRNTWTGRITIDRREVVTAIEGYMANWGNISYTTITMKNNPLPISIVAHYPTFREEWKAIIQSTVK